MCRERPWPPALRPYAVLDMSTSSRSGLASVMDVEPRHALANGGAAPLVLPNVNPHDADYAHVPLAPAKPSFRYTHHCPPETLYITQRVP